MLHDRHYNLYEPVTLSCSNQRQRKLIINKERNAQVSCSSHLEKEIEGMREQKTKHKYKYSTTIQ